MRVGDLTSYIHHFVLSVTTLHLLPKSAAHPLAVNLWPDYKCKKYVFCYCIFIVVQFDQV